MRKKSILTVLTALGLVVSMSLSAQAANINSAKKRICIEDIRKEICDGNLGNFHIITFPNCNKPGIGEPETTAPEINEPETTTPEINEPETTTPEINEPETTIPETGEQETSQPETSRPEADKEDKSFAEQVADLVNAERIKAGLNKLVIDKEISAAALIRAKEIETSFSHTRPDGRRFTTVLTDNGIRFRGAGENIAWGFVSPEKVMEAWMNSEGHRANILDPDYRKIGVGYNKSSSGTGYWTQLFTY